MKTVTIQKLNDPGHGWFSIPVDFLIKNNVNLRNLYEKITVNPLGTRIYLEEDCEYKKLFDELKNNGFEIKIKHSHSNKQSKVRNLPVVSTNYLYEYRGVK